MIFLLKEHNAIDFICSFDKIEILRQTNKQPKKLCSF